MVPLRRGIPLWIAIAGVSVVQIILAAGLVGYISFRSRRAAVEDLAGRLSQQVAVRIQEHLGAFLATPQRIIAFNAALIDQRALDPSGPRALQRLFEEEVRLNGAVTSVYFGNQSGGLAGSGREGAGGALYLTATEAFRSGSFLKHAALPSGEQGELLQTVAGFDARTRPWYRSAVERGGAGWSDIYALFTGQDTALAASRPVYGEGHELVGVLSVDLFLSHLGAFLGSLDIGDTGVAYVVDRQGLLVASSTAESASVPSKEGGSLVRRGAGDSADPLIRSTAEALLLHYGSYGGITEPLSLSVSAEGKRQLVEVLPFRDGYGLDWLIVVDVPESDFMAEVLVGSRSAALAAFLTLVLLAALAGIIAWREARTLRDLAAFADAVGDGAWERPLRGGKMRELRDLAVSFTTMSERLRETLGSLQKEVEERREAERALWDSRERLALALRGADLATWDWDVPSGRVTYNERWATMLGYTVAEIEPHVRSWERLVHPDDMPGADAALQAHLKGVTPAYQSTHRLKTKDGGWRWVLDTGRVLSRDEAGRPLRAAGVHLDLTDLHRVEDELRSSNRRLEETIEALRASRDEVVRRERLAAVGEVAAGISHVFNNVMTGIAGYAELIRNTKGTPESAREDASGILAQARRAAQLAEQLQDLGHAAVSRSTRFDVARVAGAVVGEIRRAGATGLTVSYAPPPAECVVRGDELQLIQALRNITRNALDAMPGGGELTVEAGRAVAEEGCRCAVCAQPLAGEWVALSVSDTGGGFPAEVLPRLFEPFFSTKPAGEAAGLGLPQAGGIVEQHGGHITAASRDGGARVVVYLPPAGGPLPPPAPGTGGPGGFC